MSSEIILSIEVPVGTVAMYYALNSLVEGEDQAKFYQGALRTLTATPNYDRILRDAGVVDFHKQSVETGIIAGLKIASKLANINFEFLG